ncbi:MAG: 16S rRNA (uracil(1498)-N(3))-methyltransferase [Anaerolineaceae bacterium]|jgi:16S rRNA (uracil1498-N3)-methyltransferase|nr:16S rRNA (uracil(1498)-N(3))-methyltransferase [Anaerolineaceae bacterium]MDI9531598.1 RsmE family RNA methyltransferase [Chloroflexota bacterium]HNZ15803.1 RsmE family RNA methyltransferase [Anaerolineaceae bacterium]HOF28182.1 RsmE family RNA methyltransferase [Anaerolineaceae bacterium]
MQHFFLEPDQIKDGVVTFPEGISRQIKSVLRLNLKTDAVIVLDNSGWEYLVQLTGSKGKNVLGEITGKQPGRAEPSVGLRLCYSLTKRDKIEMILQKTTEIGVTRFQPYFSSRSLVQDIRNNSARQERLNAIIREAAEQSMRSKLPVLEPACEFEAMLAEAEACPVKLIAWEGTAIVSQVCAEMLNIGAEGKQEIALLIGPEGGFSSEEVKQAEAHGFRQISLGTYILRMETACIAGCAIIRHLCW